VSFAAHLADASIACNHPGPWDVSGSGSPQPLKGEIMAEVIYEIVEHDGGWAYKASGVFSETFPTHAAARAAADAAAAEQRVPGPTEAIEYEDEKGRWHNETASGSDRPATGVKDKA
jgi:hypothetical protein